MKKFKYIFFLFVLSISLKAQLSPPGLGKADIVQWSALGIRQDLNDKWQSMTYTGWGSKSENGKYNPLSRNAIWVLNQEFYKKINKKWKYSLALSYRKQNEYDTNDFDEEIKDVTQEFRIYGRINYELRMGKWKISPTLREDIRKFYTKDFKASDEDWQFRSRLKLQITYNLDDQERHKLIAGAESLFATSHNSKLNEWSNFKYKESRFTFYYSYSPENLPVQFNIGYMNNLIGDNHPYGINYIAFDMIITNLF